MSGSQACGKKAKAARLAMPTALPCAFLQPSRSDRSSSALAEVPTRAKSFWQALITQLVVALGLSCPSQKSTVTWRPASPPLALTPAAHALTAFTESWNSPGTSGLLTSAMMPTFMVVAVSPMSVPAALATGEAPVVSGADPAAEAAAEVAAADALAVLPLPLLLEELHPAASRIAATRPAISPAKRVRLRVRCPAPPRPGPSLLGLTLCPPRLHCL